MPIFIRFSLLALLLSACAHEAPAPLPPPPAPRVAAGPSDSALDAADRAVERSVREMLALAGVSSFDVFVRSRRGHVSLSGEVPSAAARSGLVEVTGRLKNVRSVKAELTTAAPKAPAVVEAKSDASFAGWWSLGLVLALALGYALGRGRRRRIAKLSTTNPESTVPEIPRQPRRAS